MRSAAILARIGGVVAGTAEYAVKAGKANARAERLLAARIQNVEDIELQAASKRRRELVGEGRAAFAANGVLLESRAGAATAMWEQDEAADAAIERLQIMQAAEDKAYGHLTAAQQRLAEGYSGAASAMGSAGQAYSGAAQTAASGYTAAVNALGALQSAAGVQKPSGTALALDIVGNIAGGVGAIYQANAGSGVKKTATPKTDEPALLNDIHWRTPSSQRSSGGMSLA